MPGPDSQHHLSFSIDHLDPLAQGVSKDHEGISFVQKVLPGERGVASVYRQNKNLRFAYCSSPEHLLHSSPQRQAPLCPHYHHCPGCHFLHTSYQQELQFKIQALARVLAPLGPKLPPLRAIPAPQRHHYRNRLQLHYDRPRQTMGLMGFGGEILPIPHCLLPVPELAQALAEWSWEQFPEHAPDLGHVEFYLRDQVQVSWNRPYGSGGFSQVNQEVNQLLRQRLTEHWSQPNGFLVDLFSGDGNLSELWPGEKMLLDQGERPVAHYHSFNLYRENAQALSRVLKEVKKRRTPPLLLLDPPRSGFKQLPLWMHQLAPEKLFYVSCHPATMVRDLQDYREHYQISSIELFDMFPGTYHYETLLLLERRS